MATTIRANTYLQRLIGAAALDTAIYEEVEVDDAATGQALATVVLASVAVGVGVRGLGMSASAIPIFGVSALLSWACWALLMFEVGVHVLPGRRTHADPYELLRTLGFSTTPAFFAILASVPGVAMPVLLGTGAWLLASMVVAVRQALDYDSTARAIVVCVTGAVLALSFAIGLGLIFGPTLS
jgi:hypothetical protein